MLDDLGYARKDQAETAVLFELIAERYERRSLIITCNQPFSAWEQIFPDPAMTVAAIDRLVHHATILEFNTESYRRRTAPPRSGRPGNCRRRRECRRHDGGMASIDQTIIQAKVTLQDIEPPIWRRRCCRRR